MHKNKKKGRLGFTLIELLVVIAIIGVLSTIAGVTVRNARQRANRAAQRAHLQSLQNAIRIHTAQVDAGTTPNPGATTFAGFEAALQADIDFDASAIAPPTNGAICYYRHSNGINYILAERGVDATLVNEGLETAHDLSGGSWLLVTNVVNGTGGCYAVDAAFTCNPATDDVYCLGNPA